MQYKMHLILLMEPLFILVNLTYNTIHPVIIPLIIAIIRARVTLNIFLPSYEQLLDLNQDAKNSIAQNGDSKIDSFNEKIELKIKDKPIKTIMTSNLKDNKK